MDMKIAARIIAVLTVGGALLAAVAVFRQDDPKTAPRPGFRDPGGEPGQAASVEAELLRCRDIGVAALDDAACRRAWDENRRHFFERRPSTRPASPASGGNAAPPTAAEP